MKVPRLIGLPVRPQHGVVLALVFVSFLATSCRVAPTEVSTACGDACPSCSATHVATSATANDPPPCEPRALPFLELARTDLANRVELQVTPVESGYCEIVVLAPAALRFGNGRDVVERTLVAGSEAETLELQTVDGSPIAGAAVQLRLYEGSATANTSEPTYVVDAVLSAPPEIDESQRRVPVLFERPDGSTIVEYMTAAEATRRGLRIANGGR